MPTSWFCLWILLVRCEKLPLQWWPGSACPELAGRLNYGSLLYFQDVLGGIENRLIVWIIGQTWIWHSGQFFIIMMLFNFDLFNKFSGRNLLSEPVWIGKSWIWAIPGKGFLWGAREGQGKSWPLGRIWSRSSEQPQSSQWGGWAISTHPPAFHLWMGGAAETVHSYE